MPSTTRPASLVQRCLIGLAGGLAASVVMNLFARAAIGDHSGHGAQPPQADRPGDDAAVRSGSSMGACYELVDATVPRARAGHGSAYGAGVWALADETILPALRLSRGGRQLPVRVHVYALAGHLVYGLTLESVTRGLTAARNRVVRA
jgi:hypothetical protein